MNDKVLPFGGPELLQQARDLCYAIEALPPGTDQTKLSSLVSDAAFALQNFQMRGEHFWPRPVDPVTAMDFGQAIKALKLGKRVTRAGWNGAGMWLEYRPASGVDLPFVRLSYPVHSKAYPDGARVSWAPSQTDMLAEDWKLFE